MMPLLATSIGFTDALTNFTPFVTWAFNTVTQEPMIYYVVIGLCGGALGLFARARNAAH